MPQLQATDYFGEMAKLMLSIEATDRSGSDLPLNDGTAKAIEMFSNVRSASQKVMLAGNGGSAAIASHAQNDLCSAAAMRAMVFTEQPLLTAISNDFGYASVYERPIELWAESGDLLYTVSSSGQSENIVRAIKAASKLGCQVITLSGFKSDNPSRQLGDLNFYVPSDVYGYVESVHTALTHYLTTGLPLN